MTAVEDTRQRAAQLRDEARSIRSRARETRARTRLLAEATAATSERLPRQSCRQQLVPPQGGAEIGCGGENDVAAPLQDTVVRRMFAAGLSLQSAAELSADPEVLFRIESAVTILDQVIREVRNAVFQDARHSRGLTVSRDILDLTRNLATTASVRVGVPADGPGSAYANARLLLTLQLMLSLIGEHATPTSVDVTANISSYNLAIEAVPLVPGAPASECASWLGTIHARVAQTGVGVAMQPVAGGTRFTCELPAVLGSAPGSRPLASREGPLHDE